MSATPRQRIVIGRQASGQPTTYRLAPPSRAAAYRRLALTVFGLDVPTLAAELRAARRGLPLLRLPRAA